MRNVSDRAALRWLETQQGQRWLNTRHRQIDWQGGYWATLKFDDEAIHGVRPTYLWRFQQPGSFCSFSPPVIAPLKIVARAASNHRSVP
jgi:hypothetical protein